jgi:hypothetical protein
MAKVDYVGLWDCKIKFWGVYLRAQRSGQQDGICCSPWQAQKIRLFHFNFFERGSWRQVLVDVPPQNYCPTALSIMKFFYGVFFLSGRIHQLVVVTAQVKFSFINAGWASFVPTTKAIDPNFGQSHNKYLYRYSNLSL